MIYRNLFILLFLLHIINVFTSCSDSSTEPKIIDESYVSLNLGDERQLVFTSDSSTIFYKVAGTTNRSDGLKVYSYHWYYGTDTIPGIEYYGIKGGYFIATELDSVKDSLNYIPSNPYREQRLGKLFPEDGDYWQSIPGDSISYYFIAKDIGSQTTFAGTFNRCFSFQLSYFLSANYAKGIGHISSVFLPDSSSFLSSYIKVKNKIYGSKMPAKNPTFDGDAYRKRIVELSCLLLGKK